MNHYRCCGWGFLATIALLAGCSRSSSTSAPQPGANPPLTKTQSLGVDLIKAFHNDPRLATASISVGTNRNTVTLDGKVASAAAKTAALQIAKSKAPGFQILNRLVVANTASENQKLEKPVKSQAAPAPR